MDKQEQIEMRWIRVEELSPATDGHRFALGHAFQGLRLLYSDRNSGGRRLTSGHGQFEAEIRKRSKYSPRTVRDMITDFEAHLLGEPSTSAKRKARRQEKISSASDPLTQFARILPYQAALAAFREAAKIYHPDCGGTNDKMQALNLAWEQAKKFYAPHRR